MDRTDYRTFTASGWRGKIHPEWAAALADADPLRTLLGWPNELIHERETARTWRIQTPTAVLYAKQERSALTGPFVGQRERSLKMLLGPSPALRTLTTTRRMARLGLGVPPIVVAARRRIGLRRVEDLLVTEQAPGVPLGRAMLEAQDAGDPAALADLLGRSVAELHRHHFIHGHLLPGHLFVTAERGDVVFIDNDETRRWWPRPPAHRRRHNLEQLTLFTRARWGHALTRRWLNSYFDVFGGHGPARRRMLRRVLVAVRTRHQRRLRRQQENGRETLAAV